MEETPCFVEGNEDQSATSNKQEVGHAIFENDSTTTSNSEHDFQYLRTKLCLLEYSLEQQRATSSYLREERDGAVSLSRSLQREVEELRRERYTGKTGSSSERRKQSTASCNSCKGPLEEEQTVIGCILALPRTCIRGLVNRAALFVWWTGVWANEGLGMLRIENKWVELQRRNRELEKDNARLLQEFYDLQKLLSEKEVEIVRENERNQELTNRLNKKCSISCGRCRPLERMSKTIDAVTAFSESLSEEIEKIKGTMDRRFAQFETVYRDIGRLTEGQRLLEIAERNLERRVKNLGDANAYDCHCCRVESSKVHADKGTDKTVTTVTKTAFPNKTTAHHEEDDSRVKMLKLKLSRVCGIFSCGFRVVVIFFLTFLVTGVLFHFLLVSSSLRLPSSPADEYYGVDLFALWSHFINWLFCLLVTE